ncbi:DNA cytosine methyltransferase [Arthrobacter sp. JCM 19049]|uniref:DNA cytosine methyltransferase n=1 Tax=Arthrobacter sp. JCM 19049 TaxID=1460643 RepID=UPI00243725CB|nr:DNA cytosine methyltransferase [Arthrobacter sp. JCM 19049]
MKVLTPSERPLRVAEFFAGIGLVRAGLEPAGFEVVWANDYEKSKKEMYEGNFGASTQYLLGDVNDITVEQLPEDLDLAWASFPCTDLSLAGGRKGLAGIQSGTFWKFASLINELREKRKATTSHSPGERRWVGDFSWWRRHGVPDSGIKQARLLCRRYHS